MGHLIRDGVIIGGTNVYVDDSLSTTSENPVQNKVITNELNNKVNTSDLSNVATTGDYNDLIDKPTIDNALSNQSTNAVQNKVVTESLNNKYSFNYDVCLSLDEWEALDSSKYIDHKNYYIYDADMNPDTVIYGFHIDPDESDPSACVTYLEDAVNMVPAYMDSNSSTFNYGSWQDVFFMPKPCMVKSDGTVDYYLDPHDYTKKEDGTASDVANASYDGNAMMEWPLIWWKYEQGTSEGEGYFYCSNKKVDNSYNCWCNYDCDNNIIEHFYTAIYNGTGTEKLRSISGVALTSANGNGNTTGQQEIDRATTNNTTSKVEWYIDVWSDRMLINGLLILMGKSLNTQVVFGRGLDTGQSAKEAYVTGTLNDKGMFWGNISAGISGVKVFGMENWWGCVQRRTAGLIGLADGNTAYKLTHGTADGTIINGYNTDGSGYLIDSTARPESGWFKTAKFGKFGYLPLTIDGSPTTYYTDYYSNSNRTGYALVGGNASGGTQIGASRFNLGSSANYAVWSIAAALTLKPLAKLT